MAEPTYEELLDRIKNLERLVTTEPQASHPVEYSFPAKNKGMDQEEFRLMNLGQANGIIHGDNGLVNDSPNSTGWRYYLDKHESDAVTNERNTLILRAGTSAESIIEGFYHRLTEDQELAFPSVSTRTLYHVCITYDPRNFKKPEGPVKIHVYPGEPPEENGRVHLLLYTVDRQPNQLLTQATVTRFRPYTAGLLSVQNRNQLPDPASYPAGTVVVPSATGHGIYVRQNGGHVWLDPISHKADKPGTWRSMSLSTNALEVGGVAVYREVAEGIQIYGQLSARVPPDNSYICSFPSSSGIQFSRYWSTPVTGTGGDVGYAFAGSSGYSPNQFVAKSSNRYLRFNAIIPDYVLR